MTAVPACRALAECNRQYRIRSGHRRSGVPWARNEAPPRDSSVRNVTTYYSDKHISACVAYVVGYPALVALVNTLGVFEFILPDYTFFQLMTVPVPRGLSSEDSLAVAYCIRAGPYCLVYSFAIFLVPLAVVWGFVTGKIFKDRAAFASAAHPRPPKFVHFMVYLVLVPVVAYYVVSPLLGLFFDDSGGFGYINKWTYLPQLAFPENLGYFVAACLVTRHSIRIRASRDPDELFDAVLAGNAQAVGEHLAAGSDPNIVRQEDGATPLHVAARAGEPEVVITLLASDADPQVHDDAGATPLHIAAAAGEPEVANTLLAGDADPQVQDHTGATPLHVAARAGEPEVVITLLASDADPQVEDDTGATPLHIAAAAGEIEVIDILLDIGADPDARNNDGRTPLDLAIAEGHTDAAGALREVTTP